jgi:signal transduction histidine kinase
MLKQTVVRPLLELGYLLAALPLAVLGFVTAVVGLSLSIGLLPLFLLGVPLVAATAYAVHGCAVLECGLADALLDEDLRPRHAPRATGRGWLARPLSYLRSPEFWKETAHALVALPLSVGALCVVVALWACAFAGLTLPAYAGRLTGGHAIAWLRWDIRLEVAAGFVAGAVLLVAAHLVSRLLTTARISLARGLLTPSESDRLRARVSTLQESRARVVDAADAERRRIERDLHDGAQQHLVAIAMNLGRAKTKMDSDPEGAKELVTEAHDAAKDSITALRNVVRGVHPAVLVDRGLDAALSALAARSPVPVRLEVDVANRPDATVEAVAYFVVSEALTNVAKHSGATRAAVRVDRADDRLLVSVSDNGHGGAEPAPGSGLTGLRDRVEAVDGTFSLSSPPSGGTTVSVEVPCAS